MPQTFDLILRGGAVVNQDGVGARDIGVNGGAHRRDRQPLGRPRPARPSIAAACTSCRA